jgi:hypothetical protein
VSYSGLNTRGVEWPRPELIGVDDRPERNRWLRMLAALVQSFLGVSAG